MKQPPLFPDYRAVTAPNVKRWGAVGLLFGLLCAAITIGSWPQDQPAQTNAFWFWAVAFPLLLMGALFAVRWLIYQVALSNRQQYRETLEQATEHWWQRRGLGLPLEHLCLLGPTGDRPADHLAALQPGKVPPALKEVAGVGQLLCYPQVLEHDLSKRELALAQQLALTLLETAELDTSAPAFQALYWCGARESAALFTQLLSAEGWQFLAPVSALDDIDDLDKAIDAFHALSGDNSARLLCAGVHRVCADEEGHVMGEAGFAWIVGHQGKCIIQRADRQQAPEETPQMLTRQVTKYAGLITPPECCVVSDPSLVQSLQAGGWPIPEYVLESCWGRLQRIAPFVAMSMAAFHSQENQQVCGWMTGDGADTSMIGVTTLDQK